MGLWHVWERSERQTTIQLERLKERDNLRDIKIDGRVILKFNLTKTQSGII